MTDLATVRKRLVDPDWCQICGETPTVEATELCADCLDYEIENDDEEEAWR